MNRRTSILAVAALSVALAGCSSGGTNTPATTSAATATVTVTVGGSGADEMTYTDPAGSGGVTRKQVGRGSVQTAKVTVPKGSTVHVQLSGTSGAGAHCWISDATDQLIMTKGSDTCQATAQ